MTDRLPAVGSGLSGKAEGESLPTGSRQPPVSHEPNWPLLYAAVIAELALLIVIFYAFTKAFA